MEEDSGDSAKVDCSDRDSTNSVLRERESVVLVVESVSAIDEVSGIRDVSGVRERVDDAVSSSSSMTEMLAD